jgi:hypothetical protein
MRDQVQDETAPLLTPMLKKTLLVATCPLGEGRITVALCLSRSAVALP